MSIEITTHLMMTLATLRNAEGKVVRKLAAFVSTGDYQGRAQFLIQELVTGEDGREVTGEDVGRAHSKAEAAAFMVRELMA